MTRRRFLALSLCACLLGCVHLASHEEKIASFKPFSHSRIGNQTLQEYLEARTAVLIAGAKPISVTPRDGAIGVELMPVGTDGKVDIGSATAVAADGYFLTAAHCLHRQPVFLVISTPTGPRGVICRVVWRPPPRAENLCDMAILKIDVPMEYAFAMADNSDLVAGEPLVTAGGNGEAGGHLLSASPNNPSPAYDVPFSYAIIHDIPLAQGDSGGPLTTLDGKLIGIEILATGLYLGPRQGIALRPDPLWLRRQIDNDRANHLTH